MADFNEAFDITLKHEGGYVNDPDDSGGETYKGVARRFNPNWGGWVMIDSLKKRSDFPTCLDSNEEIHLAVSNLYRANYWNQVRGDKIDNQIIANKLFDIAINMGAKTAVKLVQMTLDVVVDGVIGSQTIKALNEYDFDLFMAEFRLVIISRYMSICSRKKSNRKFLYGWIKRALS